MWAEGLTIRQIAAALGSSTQSIGSEIVRLRKEGHDLPYRQTPEQVARIRESLSGKRSEAA